MIRIYLINLDRSPKRLDFMAAQFKRLGLSVERIPAVDGSAIDLSPYAGSGLTPGEVGCFLSHRAAWQRIVESPDEHALVIEDDVRLGAALPQFLANSDWIPAAARIVKLDTSGKRIGVTKTAIAALEGRTLHRLLTLHTGSAGYTVSRVEAAALIERSKILNEAVDHFLFGEAAVDLSERGIFQIVPAVIVQEKRFNTHVPGLDSLILAERRAKRPSRLRRLGRNVVRPFRQAIALVTRLYRTAVQDIRFLRVNEGS